MTALRRTRDSRSRQYESSRRRTYGLVGVLAVAAVATLVLVLGANADGSRHQQAQTPLGIVSARSGADVALLPRDTSALDRFAGSGYALHDVSLLGVRNGRAYYRIENSNGAACYAVGDVGDKEHLLGQILCAPDFPSAARPLLDFTVIHGGASAAQDRVWRSEGIAADAVRSVAFQTPDGRIVGRTPVVGNIYSVAPPPKGHVTRLVAKDASGATVAWVPTSR